HNYTSEDSVNQKTEVAWSEGADLKGLFAGPTFALTMTQHGPLPNNGSSRRGSGTSAVPRQWSIFSDFCVGKQGSVTKKQRSMRVLERVLRVCLPIFIRTIAVGMRISAHPPHRSRRARFTHR